MNMLLARLFLVLQTSLYSFHFTANDGQDVSFNRFRGKQMLIVNTAGKSKYSAQYGSLEQLYQKYKDSLIIIAFPSNDFQNEDKDDQGIENYVMNNYHIHYFLASRLSVSGENISPVYNWLTHFSENGILENPVPGDFTKFLIDNQGNIKGIFSGQVDPMSQSVQDAIVE